MIKIEINGTNPLEVFAQAAVYGLKLMQIPDVRDATDLVLAMEQHWKNTQTPDIGIPTSNPKAPPKSVAPTPEPEPPAELPAEDKPASAPTIEEVRAKGMAAGQQHGNAAVKAILKEMGVTKMSDLAESDRAAFLQKLESLGDGNA